MSLEYMATVIGVLIIGVCIGWLALVEYHHCPPPATLSEQESQAVALFKQSLHVPKGTPHRHLFTERPQRSKGGWNVWDCLICPQEYTARSDRIKPEANIV